MADEGAPATGEGAQTPAATAAEDVALGAAGEKALEAMKERARKAESTLKELSGTAKERDELRSQLEQLQEQSKSEQEKALEKAVKDAETRVRQELESTVNTRLVRAEVRAQAAGILQDAEDAVRFIDLSDFKVDDEGNVDNKAVRAAIDNLVKERPYLAGKGRPKGDVDQGARKGSEAQVAPGLGRLASAYGVSSNNT